MKKYIKVAGKAIITMLALVAGFYLGKYFFEPIVSVGNISHSPQMFADRTFKVKGCVSHKAYGLGSWLKIYWLDDPETGQCLPVSTDRNILPPAGMPLTIRAKLAEPVVLPWGRQLLLLEQKTSPLQLFPE